MSTTQLRIAGAGLFFVFIFLFGFWLSRSGKPYNLVDLYHPQIGRAGGDRLFGDDHLQDPSSYAPQPGANIRHCAYGGVLCGDHR